MISPASGCPCCGGAFEGFYRACGADMVKSPGLAIGRRAFLAAGVAAAG